MTLTVRPRTIFKTKRHNMGLMSEHVEHGFGPVWDGESRALILGSMPSPKSRAAAFYYMHPQNRFWPVMQALFANSCVCSIESGPCERVESLQMSGRF